MRMVVSVIVPTRNRAALLSMTLRSVLRQRDVELEVIVVDEASTDETPALLAGLGDVRVRVIRHERPLGVSSARNRGIAAARSEWIAFVDDDDLWAPDKLARQLEAARTGGCDWVYTGSVSFTTSGQIVSSGPPLSPQELVAALPRYNAIPGGGSNVLVRRTVATDVGLFDTRLRNTEDWEMWIRLSKHGMPACVCSPLVARRLHSSNSSLDIDEIVRGTKLIETLHHTRADWGRLHRWMAHSCLRAGQRRAALGQFARAAMRGKARVVASDLAAVLNERIAHRFSNGGPITRGARPTAVVANLWIASAAAWLQDLDPLMHV